MKDCFSDLIQLSLHLDLIGSGEHLVRTIRFVLQRDDLARPSQLMGTYLNTLPRALLTSLALALEADAHPPTQTDTSQSLDGIVVKGAKVDKVRTKSCSK